MLSDEHKAIKLLKKRLESKYLSDIDLVGLVDDMVAGDIESALKDFEEECAV